jgi:hypothetical protein
MQDIINIYSRPFPGAIALPEDAVIITLTDYLRIPVKMLKVEMCSDYPAGL